MPTTLSIVCPVYNEQDNVRPFYDELTQQFRYVVSTLGNLKFKSPRNFFKIVV